MTTDQQEGRLSPASLMWGIFWRNVVWYAAAGMALGGLYGCAFAGSIVFFLSIPVGLVCAVLGWIAARGTRMRPLLGGVIVALVGLTLGGFPLAFAYGFALLMGGTFGGMYGLAAGMLCGIVIPVVTRARYFPLRDAEQYRRFVCRAGLILSLAAILCLWTIAFFIYIPPLSDFTPDLDSRSFYSGFSWNGILGGVFITAIFIVIPSLALGLAAEWRGGFLLDWYAYVSGLEPGAALPARRLERTVESALVFWFRDWRLRWATLGAVVVSALVAATVVGVQKYQNRHEQIEAPGVTSSAESWLSPGGEWLVVQAEEGYETWSVEEGKRVDYTPAERAAVWEWSPDGTLVADSCPEYGPPDCSARVLRTEDASEVARLPADGINQFSWSPDSSVLAMVETESISLWRVRDEKLLHTFKGEYLIGQKPIFSPDGSLLATNEEWNAGTVLWNIESGRRERVLRPSPRFEPHKDITVFANDVAAFSPDGELFARGGGGGQATVWRTTDGKVLSTPGEGASAVALAFSPDGSLLAIANSLGEIAIWRTSDGARVQDYDSPGFPIWAVAFSPDDDQLVSYDYDLRTWPVREES